MPRGISALRPVASQKIRSTRPLVRGRSFTDRNNEKSQLVTVIDEDSAHRVFPGQDPIGKYLRTGLSEHPVEIVGIAGRVKHSGLDPDTTAQERAQLYFPVGQLPDNFLPFAAKGITGIVRSKTSLATLMLSIRKSLNGFDSERAAFGEQRMTDAIAGSLAPRRFSLFVLGLRLGFASRGGHCLSIWRRPCGAADSSLLLSQLRGVFTLRSPQIL